MLDMDAKAFVIDTDVEDKLEIGGGINNSIIHPNMDVRKHENVDIVHSLESFPYPFKDNSFHLVVGLYVMEHLNWKDYHSGNVQNEIYRILKPGGVAFFLVPNTKQQMRDILECNRNNPITFSSIETLFGSQDYGENCHKMAFSPEFVKELFEPYGFVVETVSPMPDIAVKVKDKYHMLYPPCVTDMVIKLTKTINLIKKKKCINLGSFTVMIKSNENEEWINLDIINDERTRDKAIKEGFIFQYADIRNSLLLDDNSIDFINSSHLIEHLTRIEGIKHLEDCYRVLKRNGKIRIGTPDLGELVDCYLNNEMNIFDSIQPESYKDCDNSEKFWRMISSGPPELIGTSSWEGHKTAYDIVGIRNILESIGFKTEIVKYDKRYDMFPEVSFYVEGTKQE